MQQEALVQGFLRRMTELHDLVNRSPLAEFMQGDLRVVTYLAQNGDREKVLPGDLSAALSLSSARITALLNSMERKGLVSREISQKDRRKINVRLTPVGQALFEEKYRWGVSLVSAFLEAMGEEDVRQLNRLLDRMLTMKLSTAMVGNGKADQLKHAEKEKLQ